MACHFTLSSNSAKQTHFITSRFDYSYAMLTLHATTSSETDPFVCIDLKQEGTLPIRLATCAADDKKLS
eukprot:scaffold101784_cov38-Prasinocladus_malaysianus.AAC.3